MNQLILKRTAQARVLHGHPWVFAGEVQELLSPNCNGSLVELYTPWGHLLGTGMYNSYSQIIWRKLSSGVIKDLHAHLEAAIRAAIAQRTPESCRRLIASEADFLPGLIVDQYEDALVVQTLTYAMDQWLPIVSDILQKLLTPVEQIFKNNHLIRKREKLSLEIRTRSGKEYPAQWFCIQGMHYYLDLQNGQKTGFYLDQRYQYELLAQFAKGRRVLDAFCNQGGFALHCAQAGAQEVVAVDISKECARTIEENARKNQLAITFQKSNMFDFFTQHKDRTWDMIILDPPPFTRNKEAIDGACRGYKELNLRALKALTPGGILATYSCSQHINRMLFQEILCQAAVDAHREVKILQETRQASDHPILLTMPESEYLKGFILQVY